LSESYLGRLNSGRYPAEPDGYHKNHKGLIMDLI